MGRYSGRSSRSYSRSPPPPSRERRRYEEPPSERRSGRSPGPSGLLVRNISLDARPEDLRTPFERFGPVKDVYLPKNYYTGESRGFGFVKFRNGEDAAEAKHHLNHTVIGGREIAIVFAAENRKTPQEMRKTGPTSGRYGGSNRRRSPPRSPRRRYRSYSRSRSPVRRESRHESSYGDRPPRNDHSPSRSRSISPYVSPRDNKAYRSNRRSTSQRKNDRSPSLEKKRSPSPWDVDHSPRGGDRILPDKDPGLGQRSLSPVGRRGGDRSISRSPSQRHYQSRSPSRSNRRSKSQRKNDRSPVGKRRSPSPWDVDHSPQGGDRILLEKDHPGLGQRSSRGESRSPSQQHHYQSRSPSRSQ